MPYDLSNADKDLAIIANADPQNVDSRSIIDAVRRINEGYIVPRVIEQSTNSQHAAENPALYEYQELLKGLDSADLRAIFNSLRRLNKTIEDQQITLSSEDACIYTVYTAITEMFLNHKEKNPSEDLIEMHLFKKAAELTNKNEPELKKNRK